MRYYTIPFDAEHPVGVAFCKTDAEESVRQHVHLLLTTMPGSFRFSPIYGSWLNKHHYRLPDKRKGERKLENELKEQLQQNLRLLLSKYEPRLAVHDIEVSVKLPQSGGTEPRLKGGRIVFDVNLTGSINGKESFQHNESIYLK